MQSFSASRWSSGRSWCLGNSSHFVTLREWPEHGRTGRERETWSLCDETLIMRLLGPPYFCDITNSLLFKAFWVWPSVTFQVICLLSPHTLTFSCPGSSLSLGQGRLQKLWYTEESFLPVYPLTSRASGTQNGNSRGLMVEKTGQEREDTNPEQRAVRDETVEDYSVKTREARKKVQRRAGAKWERVQCYQTSLYHSDPSRRPARPHRTVFLIPLLSTWVILHKLLKHFEPLFPNL